MAVDRKWQCVSGEMSFFLSWTKFIREEIFFGKSAGCSSLPRVFLKFRVIRGKKQRPRITRMYTKGYYFPYNFCKAKRCRGKGGKTNAVIREISCHSWQKNRGHEGHEW